MPELVAITGIQAEKDWRPSADWAAILLRAQVLAMVRDFFRSRAVLEVDTPILSAAAPSDLHLHSMSVELSSLGASPTDRRRMYLQTSPESAMKRLLAAGSGAIFQICKAFRNGEYGPHHNPEFTLLEWYRPNFQLGQLMDEVEALVAQCLVTASSDARRLSYSEAMLSAARVDALTDPDAVLREACGRFGAHQELAQDLDREQALDYLLTHAVQPALGPGMCFVTDFPASQAAMAQVSPGPPEVALRFELFLDGVELANGYCELTDADELARRIDMDQTQRRQQGLSVPPRDERLLAAMQHGLPESCGVALGLDRLISYANGSQRLAEVLSFDVERA